MILIGEKINGAIPSVADAIARRDEEHIRRLARIQEDAEADYLDCCACVAKDEPAVMEWLMELMQDETDTPLCVDSPNARVLEHCLPLCKRPGLVNSVSLERDKTEVIFPAIQGSRWGCIALLSGEKGIPRTPEERLDNFRRIMDRAAFYGIAPDRLYIDPLVEGLATNQQSLLTFAAVCRGLREIAPEVHITSGLSNISFGLPARKMLNMAFLVLAMEAGMDSAILDPTNRDLRGILYAADALLGEDDYCMEYISAYRQGLFGPQSK